jgi:hypothetical protein
MTAVLAADGVSEMSNPYSSSSTGASTENPIDLSDKTNHSKDQYRKPRIHVIVSIAFALAGAAILAFSAQFFLFHPMTATDEYIGRRMWIVGSWLLGGGVALTVARPWVAALLLGDTRSMANESSYFVC